MDAYSDFADVLEAVPDAVLGVGMDGTVVFANGQAERLFDFPREQLVGNMVEVLIPLRYRHVHEDRRRSYFEHPRTRPMGLGFELYARRRDGSEFPVEISLSSLEIGGSQTAVAAIRDVTARAEGEREKTLQRQLDRARRLESVGQLAGGIAHDFNNLLGVILNYAEFVVGELPEDSPAVEDVREIRAAAERAAALTRQLLIYSRREVAQPRVLYLREVIADLENLLRRALGERIELDIHVSPTKVPVEIDPGQLEQVLVNLAVNARDAMPDGGRLVIEVERAELDAEYTYVHPGTEPGAYARLTVSDTGVGMDQATMEHVFDPFFTTKEDGTGLGLATVYGIVTGSGGRIDIYSEPGLGTTVKIHLPIADDLPPDPAETETPAAPARGETLLIAEDEPEVRRMIERILTRAGYLVIAVSNGAEALEVVQEKGYAVDLVITDVIMAGMLGPEMVDALRSSRPEMKVLYMSGYSHAILSPDALQRDTQTAFLGKPFTSAELLVLVRELLDGASAIPGNQDDH